MDERIIKIAEHYGFKAQSRQAQEECAELIQAINKYHRVFFKEGQKVEYAAYDTGIVEAVTRANLIEELADVQIMIDELVHLLKVQKQFESEMEYKLNRTLNRMEEEKSEGK